MQNKLSYVSGFKYNLDKIFIEMNVVPFVINNQKYETIIYKKNYCISLVKFFLEYEGNSINIFVPFYRSTGSNSSLVGAGTWFPFHCVSHSQNQGATEYYYRSNYGDAYIFKIGHYFDEPFTNSNKVNSICFRQRRFLSAQTSEILPEILKRGSGSGVHTVLQRFGNLLYLTASYFLFGNPSGWDPNNYQVGSEEHSFATVLTRISLQAKFGSQTWRDINLPITYFNDNNKFMVDNGKILNNILMNNNVALPHYQEVIRNNYSPDAKFITYLKMLQIVGELYLEISSISLWNHFKSTFRKCVLINNIPLNQESLLNIKDDYHVWLLPEIFSGNDCLVRLYTFR